MGYCTDDLDRNVLRGIVVTLGWVVDRGCYTSIKEKVNRVILCSMFGRSGKLHMDGERHYSAPSLLTVVDIPPVSRSRLW